MIDVHRGDHGLEIKVETDPEPVGCRVCGVVVVGHGRLVVRAADAPCFGLSVRVLWRKRVWRCPESACPARTWSETHPLIGPQAALTRRAVAWATDALAHDDTTVSALARHVGGTGTPCGTRCAPRPLPASPSPGGWSGVDTLKTRRLAHGFRNFRSCRLRILLFADASGPYRPRPNHA